MFHTEVVLSSSVSEPQWLQYPINSFVHRLSSLEWTTSYPSVLVQSLSYSVPRERVIQRRLSSSIPMTLLILRSSRTMRVFSSQKWLSFSRRRRSSRRASQFEITRSSRMDTVSQILWSRSERQATDDPRSSASSGSVLRGNFSAYSIRVRNLPTN